MGVICVIWYKIFTVFQNYWGGGVSATAHKSQLRGGMYSANNNSNFPWNVLENKFALIGRVP
jgi:hypothetical protein